MNRAVRALLDVIAGVDISDALHKARSNKINDNDGENDVNDVKNMVAPDEGDIYADLCATIMDISKSSRKIDDTALDALVNDIDSTDVFFNNGATVDGLEALQPEEGNFGDNQGNDGSPYRLFQW